MILKRVAIVSVLLIVLYTVFFGKKTIMKFTRYAKGDSWNKMIPIMKTAVEATIDECNAQGIDALFYEGHRTVERSQEMINKGVSKLSNPANSDHVWGIGVDIVKANAFGFASWPTVDDIFWKDLHKIGAKHGLEFYISWDKAHARLKGYTVGSIKAQYDNPENFMSKMA